MNPVIAAKQEPAKQDLAEFQVSVDWLKEMFSRYAVLMEGWPVSNKEIDSPIPHGRYYRFNAWYTFAVEWMSDFILRRQRVDLLSLTALDRHFGLGMPWWEIARDMEFAETTLRRLCRKALDVMKA